ncbi:MAG: hypothetical protein A2Z62_00870 [Candidatus Terrybacteria bacterium RIFCSPLOWO2_02_42_20]|uniref:Nudix hydrolase domain-containing protein n=1 Tax=Candidatus Terrybacteria bacterium RIFCSPLOWO2_02_42_20 TaxID=1802370 RepID=A0A1G2Q337_9BACT|nr:MAG: hypothetical protein A2Z62_00870 [Candidatus Terrybacteria bacterium RIFCSPLOWO2_02_42_20]
MAIITGFVEPKRDYAVFVLVTGMQGIPLVIEKGNFSKKMWKLPGGRPAPEDDMDRNITAMREVNDEIGIVVEYPEKEVFRIKKQKHDFIVLEAKYFSGDFIAKAEIERVELFDFAQIRQMIQEKQILPDHAEALLKHIDEVTAFNVVYV